MATPKDAAGSSTRLSASGLIRRFAPVIIVSSVTFTFISYWRTAAVVLCDLASTAYYIGGIVETSIGPAAPWFILAVMVFSYAVRSVYIESCTLFIRGGVYKVVREALGRFFAKFAVSALLFDYILTGPISGVSAGQYIMGLLLEGIGAAAGSPFEPAALNTWKERGSVVIAVAVTLYFFRQNLIGIHESSDKAMKIMIATTIMGAIVIGWCGLTLAVQGPKNSVPVLPDLNTHVNYSPYPPEKENPMGFIRHTPLADRLREARVELAAEAGQVNVVSRDGRLEALPLAEGATITLDGKPATLDDLARRRNLVALETDSQGLVSQITATTQSDINWLSLVGVIGLLLAFGHSILAMSGEETLAQVYREVESPKLKNFKRAAFIVFVYSLALTGTISFLAVLLIPDSERMPQYSDNLIGGLAMNVWGNLWMRFALRIFVVVIGFLILSGAVNTAIIGCNGVLNRVAEDGVLPDAFLKPHPRYGTTYRILWVILALQLFVILLSRGNVIKLGEAYAFGVVWSFVFQALSMVVLRFKDRRPREYMVPLNIKVGGVQVPVGLGLILVVLLVTAVLNLLTKETATIWGGLFTFVLFGLFMASEVYHERKRRGAHHQHLEQFNRQTAQEITAESLGLTKLYRKLVSIRSPHNLFMLEKSLAETDPETTGVVVMTAKVVPTGGGFTPDVIDPYDQELMTAVVQLAERAGKEVKPLIVPTNNPLHAVLQTAKDLQANELILGASNKYTADEQMEQIAFYWISLHHGMPAPLTVRILSRERDMYLDLAGGNRIPKISERRARSVAELRAAGVGVDRVLLIHDGSPASSDLFQAVLTMLDPQVRLTVVPLVPPGSEPHNGHSVIHADEERARRLGRELAVSPVEGEPAPAIVEMARREQHDLIIQALHPEVAASPNPQLDAQAIYLLHHAHCRVFLAVAPLIPPEIVDTQPSPA